MIDDAMAVKARKERVLEVAIQALGDEQMALAWLSSSSVMLGGVPLDLAGTGEGFKAVLEELVRIEYGDVA